MRTKLPEIVKLCVLPVCVLFLSMAFFLPTFLGASQQAQTADATAEATAEHQGFLPIILNQDEVQAAHATSTIIPTATPSPPASPSPIPLPSITPSPTPTATPALGPPIPPIPTAGITPSRTPSPTPTNLPTSTATPRSTATFTPNPTATPTQTFTPTPTNTAPPTPTSTPRPADLTTGKPQLISTPPIVAHAPLQFSVSITNYGEVDINQQFFVDIFLDPQNVHIDHIPLAESSGFVAVSSLGGGQSKQLTSTASFGFNNSSDSYMVYAMVDSMKQIDELLETNNIASSAVGSEDTEFIVFMPLITFHP